jgi:hypothetical protein
MRRFSLGTVVHQTLVDATPTATPIRGAARSGASPRPGTVRAAREATPRTARIVRTESIVRTPNQIPAAAPSQLDPPTRKIISGHGPDERPT